MTDNITIRRALLEQALEALEACYSSEYDGAKIYAAKLALRAALAAPDDIAAEMSTVADQYAHKLALDLECVLADYSGTWYDAAMTTLGAYREAMNAIHERESPTFMGEPVIRPTQAAPATDDRHAQELLAMEITLQNMQARHAQELRAYELTVQNLRAELAKPQTTPAWHDEPNAPGLWVRSANQYTGPVVLFAEQIPVLRGSAARWYGPIPQDKEGGAA